MRNGYGGSLFQVKRYDLEMEPFNTKVIIVQMYQLFSDGMGEVNEELNRVLGT